MEYAVFRTGQNHYALGTEWITEIKQNYTVSFMPFVPPYVLGLIASDGVTIPIISVNRLEGGSFYGSGACAVIGTRGRPLFGLDAGEYVTIMQSDKIQHRKEIKELDINAVFKLDFFKNFREE